MLSLTSIIPYDSVIQTWRFACLLLRNLQKESGYHQDSHPPSTEIPLVLVDSSSKLS